MYFWVGGDIGWDGGYLGDHMGGGSLGQPAFKRESQKSKTQFARLWPFKTLFALH